MISLIIDNRILNPIEFQFQDFLLLFLLFSTRMPKRNTYDKLYAYRCQDRANILKAYHFSWVYGAKLRLLWLSLATLTLSRLQDIGFRERLSRFFFTHLFCGIFCVRGYFWVYGSFLQYLSFPLGTVL